MHHLYLTSLLLLAGLFGQPLRGNSYCHCEIEKADGQTTYSAACDRPEDICALTIGEGLGELELYQFIDLRGVDVVVGKNSRPKFLASTLVSSGSKFTFDGTEAGLDVMAGGRATSSLAGPTGAAILNGMLLDLDALVCLSIRLNLFGPASPPSGPCTLGESGNMPVDLLSWTALPVARGISLRWETAAEADNDFYRLLHSTDGQSFRELQRVSGQGTTRESTTYEFLHERPSPGTNFYRIDQHDYDGTVNSLGIRGAEWMGSTAAAIAVSPNPATAGALIHLDKSRSEGPRHRPVAQLVDQMGRLIGEYPLTAEGSLHLPTDIPTGLYVLRFANGAVKVMVEN
ncbi:hypothetical protein [Lewinella sp. JB7]|uniref:hypothetical protein n=1 Tax=Lewinella sp. JB7 TaxID=2962887 RepID=UPI0020CA0C16|nr:hypothetical protein [Lewinella sp. JB7]MCP9234812.1 hypothetical protein [Lewinella sp. JB7]